MTSVTTDQRRGTNASAAIKVPCVCATTGNITLSGEQTIDGILTSETRVLAKDQTDASENGIYESSSGAWTRVPDWNGAYDVQEGTLVFVSRGTINAQTLWRVATTGDITVGTTNVTISQQSLDATAILSDGSVEMAAHWVPAAHNTYDHGEDSTPKRWRHGYYEGNVDIDGTLNVEGAVTYQASAHYDDAIQYLDKGADVASAGALTLGTDGNYYDITGTTSITSIGALGVGTVVKLHFDGALTLTHHATDLILPGGANITTAAGDEAEFVEYAAGDWRCTSYVSAATAPVEATQSEMETGTTSTRVITPAVKKFHSSSAKLWVNFNGTGTVAIQDSYNVSSITDNGTGDYTVNFSDTLNNANYAVVVGIRGSGADRSHGLASLTTTSVNVLTNDGVSAEDQSIVCVVVFAN